MSNTITTETVKVAKEELEALRFKMLDLGEGSEVEALFPTSTDEEPIPAPKKGLEIWSSTPTYQDQFEKFPNTCRLKGPSIQVFNLNSAQDVNRLNNLLARCRPETAPEIVIIERSKQFYEGTWSVYVEYMEIEYLSLIDEHEKNSSE